MSDDCLQYKFEVSIFTEKEQDEKELVKIIMNSLWNNERIICIHPVPADKIEGKIISKTFESNT